MTKPKKIINNPSESVDEFIQGLLLQYPNKLVKLQNHHVLLASSTPQNSVQLISGGGSGHEPSHAGWLGTGMLSAAVCGGIFASPSVSSILAAIRAVSKKTCASGVLLVIKNYTGDRLNFGMAAEKANQEGIPTQMVVVADDCALPRAKGITGSRGVAGTVLVHKIAGAASDSGRDLEQVLALARLTCSRMGTLGVAMGSVTVPGADTINDRLDEKTIEIGLGIHGEAGMKQSPLLTADEMAREMIDKIQSHGRVEERDGTKTVIPLFEKGDEVVVLVNNLGGTSNFEMYILALSTVKLLESEDFGAKATRVLVGSFMTSFDMHGASITILNVENQPELLELLDAQTEAVAWTTTDVWKTGTTRPSANEVPEVLVENDASLLQKPPLSVEGFPTIAGALLKKAAAKIVESEPLLTKYDTIVGDGDCGITMKRGATEIQERLEKQTIPLDHPVTMFDALADAISASMGGTSGVLLELMFRKISSTLCRAESIGTIELCESFRAGVEAVSLVGGAQVGSRTMLDALVPAASTLVETQSLTEAATKAREGAVSTSAMKSASAGRSNYLNENSLSGTPDPGAEAVAIALEAISD
jgi:dihydroxyacetone kinase